MKKRLLFVLVISLTGILSTQAKEKFEVIGPNCQGTGMSPNGKYVVGIFINKSNALFGAYPKSYLYNVESGQQDWLTDYDETDLSKTGNFMDVTDDGLITGYFKDPNYQITSEGRLFPLM